MAASSTPKKAAFSPDASKSQSPESFLYTRIAANHLGDTAATVISTLISYGRLTAKDISTRSSLPLKRVKTSLVSLIQLNSIHYWVDSASKATYYSFSPQGMKVLLHAGDIIAHVKTRYGEKEAEIVQNVIENGNILVKDYVSSFPGLESQYEKMEVLMRLYTEGWLRRLQPVDFSPLEDIWNRLYQESLKNVPRTATTSEVKRVAEAREKTKIRLNDLLNAGTDLRDVTVVEDGQRCLRPNITLTINLSRFEKALRTRALVSLVNSRHGLIAAQIYSTCCFLVEKNLPDLHHRLLDITGLIADPEEQRVLVQSVENALVDTKATVFNIRDVAKALPANLDLRNSILTQNFLKPGKRVNLGADSPPAKKVKLEEGISVVTEASTNGFAVDPHFDDDDDKDEKHLIALLAEHMRLLTSGNVTFVFETSPGSYAIPYNQLSRHVKSHHYDALVKTTLGHNAHRVLKCIKTMKLVDEKAISNLVLLKEKTVKSEVYRLVTSNVVEIQEVPRSADRAALKTFYLFRHKESPSYRFVDGSLIYSMADALSNIDRFKLEHRILLDKCEREDVKGHEEELLLDTELKTLRDLQTREINCLGRLHRTKWLHFIFGVL